MTKKYSYQVLQNIYTRFLGKYLWKCTVRPPFIWLTHLYKNLIYYVAFLDPQFHPFLYTLALVKKENL